MNDFEKQINSTEPLIWVKKNKEGIYKAIYGKTFVVALQAIKETGFIKVLDMETNKIVTIDDINSILVKENSDI